MKLSFWVLSSIIVILILYAQLQVKTKKVYVEYEIMLVYRKQRFYVILIYIQHLIIVH